MAKKQIPALLKPRTRDSDSFARTKGKREAYDYVLIVCEGTKTEPCYLRELQRVLRLSNANIKVLDRRHGSDPMSVLNAALEEYEKDTLRALSSTIPLSTRRRTAANSPHHAPRTRSCCALGLKAIGRSRGEPTLPPCSTSRAM